MSKGNAGQSIIARCHFYTRIQTHLSCQKLVSIMLCQTQAVHCHGEDNSYIVSHQSSGAGRLGKHQDRSKPFHTRFASQSFKWRQVLSSNREKE